MRVWPGQPYPLGATWDGEGVNFALFSENATDVELCLFGHANDAVERLRIPMRERNDQVWHSYLPDVRPGQLYGYRVYGKYAPREGHRFNAAKLLLDPYAKAISGTIQWSDALFGYRIGGPDADYEPADTDSAPGVPKCVVIDNAFTWGDDRAPKTPWPRTVIYECHVKGMTIRHPDVEPHLRGTYLGLASDPMIDYFRALGVTAVELLPVHHYAVDRHLGERGLTNYWGYNTVGYFAPDVRYATGGLASQVYEFKTMVKRFHSAGIEVILDVVYNHTGEGNHFGPTLCFRGIDNKSYYRLMPDDPSRYQDFTGTGNSLDMRHPRTIQLIMDSLRYWVQEMHVDGFRFDLAPVLGREHSEMSATSSFFDIIHQDPVLASVKLIAEPWDVGPGGYQAGNFPVRWAEWNGKYRDAVRRFWRGDAGMVPELASRLSGSSDIYQWSDRGAYASVNFVTAHDGFTLRDLVSYVEKHNEDNGEHNQDGHDENLSRNFGVEGDSDDEAILEQRFRYMRNFLATLAFSQGVPMISHGDEIARTQRGNNNAYSQDNEITWVDWDLDDRRRDLLEFARTVFAIRHANPVLRRRTFFRGRPVGHEGHKDVTWVRPDGRELTWDDWHDTSRRALGMLVHGEASDEMDDRGRPVRGDTMLMILNGGDDPVDFVTPPVEGDLRWVELVNTFEPSRREPRPGPVRVAGGSLVLLRAGSDRRLAEEAAPVEAALPGAPVRVNSSYATTGRPAAGSFA